MRHLVSGRKLKRTSSHRKALLANLATELFRYKSIKTTEAKAKELRPYAEALITKAKNALLREKSGQLSDGQSIDVHSRRMVGRQIRVKEVLSELFDSIAPAVIERNGGYTRVVKTGIRRGDASKTAIIELVDFAAPQDGSFSMKRKKKVKPAAPKTEEVAPKVVVDETPALEVANDVVEEAVVTEEVTAETNVDAPVAEESEVIASDAVSEEPATEVPAEEEKKD